MRRNVHLVEISFSLRVKACVEVGIRFFAGQNSDAAWQKYVYRIRDFFRRNRSFQIEAYNLPQGVHSRVGAAACSHNHGFSRGLFYGVFQRFLHGRQPRLPLPTEKVLSVVFDDYFISHLKHPQPHVGVKQNHHDVTYSYECSREITVSNARFFHFGAVFGGVIAPCVQSKRQLVGPSECGYEHRHQNGYHSLGALENVARVKVCASCLLRIYYALRFVHKRRDKP